MDRRIPDFVGWLCGLAAMIAFVVCAIIGLSGKVKSDLHEQALQTKTQTIPAELTPIKPEPTTPVILDKALFGYDAGALVSTIDKSGYIAKVVGRDVMADQLPSNRIRSAFVTNKYIFVVAGNWYPGNDGALGSWDGNLYRFRRSDLKTDRLSLEGFDEAIAISTTAVKGDILFVSENAKIGIIDPEQLTLKKWSWLCGKHRVGQTYVEKAIFSGNNIVVVGGINIAENDIPAIRDYPCGMSWSGIFSIKSWKVTQDKIAKRKCSD